MTNIKVFATITNSAGESATIPVHSRTCQDADNFRKVINRPDWKIISYYKADYKPTAKQQSAVRWASPYAWNKIYWRYKFWFILF